jgi:hypothetical protein
VDERDARGDRRAEELTPLLLVHLAAIAVWASAWAAYARACARARRGGPEAEQDARRRWHRVRHLEALALVLSLAAGLLLMRAHGMSLAYPRWLPPKLGLVAFVLVPLEAFRVYISVGWLGPGLFGPPGAAAAKQLERGLSMDGMLQALAVPLLLLALPGILYLSLARPF